MSLIRKKIILAIAVMSLVISVGGCQFGGRKQKKPVPQPTTKVDDGNAKAKGSGDGQSDVPLVIGCGSISKNINPFAKLTDADKQIVSLTQVKLVTCDRNGRVVNHAVDGEVRSYNGTEYTYYGPADIDVRHDEEKEETVYSIRIRDDLSFSDSKAITVDDVIFTIYALCDEEYSGNETLGKQGIKGLGSYRKGKAPSIEGIEKVDEYKMTITTDGYDKDFIYSLQIPICPLHYYGDETKFDTEKNFFGFKRGDLQAVTKNHPSLLGAGAYRFVKYEKGIAYFTSNESYYRGCPNIAYLQMKEMDKLPETDEEQLPHEATEVFMGTVDIVEFYANAQDISQIDEYDSDKKKSDVNFLRKFVTTESFYTLGVSAKFVHVGTKHADKKSVNLRHAFQIAMRDGMESLRGIYGVSLKAIDYQFAPDSWLYPDNAENGETDKGGDKEDNKDLGEGRESEAQILACLKKAGYKIRSDKAVKAPKGAKMAYSVGITGGKNNPVYPVVVWAAESLKETGITLRIIPVKNDMALNGKLKNGAIQLWVEDNSAENVRNLKEYFTGSDSYFGIEDAGLMELFEKSGKVMADVERQECYRQCFESVAKLYVDIPLFQQYKTLLISSKRIKTDTVAKDVTPYYGFIDEIHLLKK